MLDDPTHPIVVYDVPSEHSDDMVLPFVESVGAAFVVDLFSPGLPFQIIASGPQDVLDALDDHGITDDVNTIVGGHGAGTATVADVVTAAGG